MVRRGGEAAAKRAREVRRDQARLEKRERREAANLERPVGLSDDEQQALLEEFARVSDLHHRDLITAENFAVERDRIFEALGLGDGQTE